MAFERDCREKLRRIETKPESRLGSCRSYRYIPSGQLAFEIVGDIPERIPTTSLVDHRAQ
jgi:hypothetical protein